MTVHQGQTPSQPQQETRAPSTGYERLDKYTSPPAPVAASLIARHFNGTPWVLEYEGRLYSDLRDQDELREVLAERQYDAIVAQLGVSDVRLALLALTAIWRERHNKQVVALITEIAEFLIYLGPPVRDCWKLLYLYLRQSDVAGICDRIMDHLTVNGYREGDEYRFVWGSSWRSRLDSLAQCDAEEAEERGLAVTGDETARDEGEA